MTHIKPNEPYMEQIWDANHRMEAAEIDPAIRLEVRERVINLIISGRYDEASNMIASFEPIPSIYND